MATSAFKSTSRRGSRFDNRSGSDNSPKKTKVPIRRSQSVSAVSRAPQSDVTSDFLNKRDNPLFWTSDSGSPPDKDIAEVVYKTSENALTAKTSERGRSVTRYSDVIDEKVAPARSLSRVNTGRRSRSVVSRGSNYVASKNEDEQGSFVVSSFPNRSGTNVAANSLKKTISGRNAPDIRRRSADCGALESSDNDFTPNREDGISTGSWSGAEERTIRAVCEQMKSFRGDHVEGAEPAISGIYETVQSELRRAILDIQSDLERAIRRENTTAVSCTSIADLSSDLVNPGAIELVLDIRREYARKLEESQERASKLRADLAMEEQLEQELSRILNEILPDPKPRNVQKSRPRKKNGNSSERKKMSKRLTEEAMAFFDECVSISTFDSSDLSAQEDPPINSIGATTPLACVASCSSVSTSYFPNACLDHKQESRGHELFMHSPADSGLTASSNSNEPMINKASPGENNTQRSQKSQFSLRQKATEKVGLQQDVRNYLKKTEKEYGKDGISSGNLSSSYFDVDEYLHAQSESFLFDRVMFKSRLDSGSMHLCEGFAISFCSFGSVI